VPDNDNEERGPKIILGVQELELKKCSKCVENLMHSVYFF